MTARRKAPRLVGGLHAAVRGLRARPRATDAALAAGLAAVLLPQSLVLLLGLRTDPGWTVPVVAALALVHLAPALRRAAPVTGYVLACLAMLVVVAAPNAHLDGPTGTGDVRAFPVLFLPSSLAFLPALNAVAAGSRRVAVPALLAALAGTGLAMLRVEQAVRDVYPGLQYRSYIALALLIAVIASWGLGVARATRARLEAAARTEAARTAILAERSRIAQDMHDVVAHSLAVVVRLAEAGALLTARSPDRARTMLVTIADTGRDALRDLRGVVDVLRDPDAAPVGGGPEAGGTPVAGPQPTLADLPAVLERIRATGAEVVLRQDGTPLPLGTAAQLAAFHVVQEAATNTVKHAGAGAVIEVGLDWFADRLVLRVEDDGGAPGDGAPDGGGARSAPVPGAGVGLAGLRDRVAAVGGTFHAAPLGRGFAVRAELPAPAATRTDEEALP